MTATSRKDATCPGFAFMLDGVTLVGVPLDGGATQTLGTAGPPAGGLACQGTAAYWATLLPRDAAAGSGGELLSLDLDAGLVSLQSGIQPGLGIDLDDAGVYWLARSWLDAAGGVALTPYSDAAPALLAPADDTGVYKAFALGPAGLASIADGSVYQTLGDGSATTLPLAAIALARSGADLVALTNLDSGAYATLVAQDGGLATPVWLSHGAPRAIVADAKGVYVAFDDSILRMEMVTQKTTRLAAGLLHVAQLGLDDASVYFTTIGDSTNPPTLWRIPR